MQEPEPGKAPGSGSGDSAVLARGPDLGGTSAEPGRAVQLVGSARAVRSRGCWGARRQGEGEGTLRDAPRLPCAQTPQQRRRRGTLCLRKVGDPGGHVGGLTRVQPPPPAQSRASVPPPPAASRALGRPEHPWRASLWHLGLGLHPHPGRRPGESEGASIPVTTATAWVSRPRSPFGAVCLGPCEPLGQLPTLSEPSLLI